MEMSWKVGTRTYSVKRIEGLAAVPPSGDIFEVAVTPVGEKDPRLVSLIKGGARTDLRAFHQAGWHFVVGAVTASGGTLRRVYRDRGGRLLIEGRRLTVRFAPDISQGQIEELLRSHDVTVKRRLGFAPNLFEVAPANSAVPRGDIVELAGCLASHREVLYAEPALIEAISGRAHTTRSAR